ncbi:MAG TPA: PHP domain-containing protein [Candidatus Scybalocola faecavium]|nr:PHP domain-containing protein [Candidatus Scybalocola faecavium]
MKTIDLHTHSNASDGTLTPAQVVREAYEAGLSAVALTDHDTADGLEEAAQAAKDILDSDRSADFQFVPGIELSVSYKNHELHLVGLHLDIHSEGFSRALKKLQNNRDQRNEKMIQKMQSAGMDITMDALRADQGGGVLTRANFASYMLHKGYISSVQEGFDKYLDRGKAFYVPREYLSPKEAIDLIHNASGLAILAHPLLYGMNMAQLEEALSELTRLGLDGLEAYYSMNHDHDTVHMKTLAQRHGLLLSGGSDFHGANKPHIKIGRGRGNLFVPAQILKTQENYLNTKNRK